MIDAEAEGMVATGLLSSHAATAIARATMPRARERRATTVAFERARGSQQAALGGETRDVVTACGFYLHNWARLELWFFLNARD